jgi:hypothetical protein
MTHDTISDIESLRLHLKYALEEVDEFQKERKKDGDGFCIEVIDIPARISRIEELINKHTPSDAALIKEDVWSIVKGKFDDKRDMFDKWWAYQYVMYLSRGKTLLLITLQIILLKLSAKSIQELSRAWKLRSETLAT